MGSLKIGTLRGIGIYIHWTFWLVMLFYALSETARSGLIGGIYTAVLMLAVFACVLAHEFGHSFAALRYGIPTKDITLLPIGGVARLERMPSDPWQEFVIAVAGPMVNVAIAAALMIFGAAVPFLREASNSETPLEFGFLATLWAINVGLVLFNLLPAFPMDGGRVLRSLLAMRTGHLRATQIAARIGRWMALLFVIASIAWGQPMLFLIGVFVVIAGTAELFEAQRRESGNPTWVKWVWTPGETTWVQGNNPGEFGSSRNPFSSSTGGEVFDDVVDAVEVRPVRKGIQSPF